MLIIPAVDLRGGKVVRLLRGEFDKETVYADDPVAVAGRWMTQGARWLHVVDLDGARTGVMQHQPIIGRIVAEAARPGTRIEVSGGIRGERMIRELFDLGVHRVVLGTKAASQDPTFRRQMLRQYGRRIAIGVDARGNEVAVQGWQAASGQTLQPAQGQSDFIGRLLADGAQCLIYTDISRDGTLEGPALERIQALVARVGAQAEVIASGGIGSLEHLKQLAALTPPPAGAIVGRALYEGAVNLKEALAL